MAVRSSEGVRGPSFNAESSFRSCAGTGTVLVRYWYGTGTVDDRVTGSVPFSSWTVFASDWRKYLCTGRTNVK